MNFYYQGKKPSSSYDIATGCLLFIGFGAIIFLLSLLEDLEDLEDVMLELVLVTLMGGSVLYGVFRKKGTFHTHRITCKEDALVINKVSIPIDTIHLDVYTHDKAFNRYHLWDSKGVLSIYSVYEDDFLKYFSENYPDHTRHHEISKTSSSGYHYRIITNNTTLYYDLDSGGFTFMENDNEVAKMVPEFYVYDPKYKEGKPLLKKT